MERKSFSIIGFGLTGICIGMLVAQTLLLTAVQFFAPELYTSDWVSFALSAVGYLVCIGLLWLVLRRLPTASVGKATIRPMQFLGFYATAMGLTYILSLVGSWLNSLLHTALNGVDTSSNPVGDMLEGMNLWAVALTACVLAPICEEIIFRKLLLDRLLPFGDKAAIIYSAVAFGLFHMNVPQGLYATALGLLLGYLVVRTGNIWYAIALHAAVNVTGSILPLALEMYGGNFINILFNYAVIGVMILAVVLLGTNLRKLRLDPPRYQLSRPVTPGLALGNAGTIVYLLVTLGTTLLLVISARMG